MKKYIIFFASLSILCFGAYFYNIKISADEYLHSATTGDIKYVFYPNKSTAVADGNDKITFTLESYYISECVEPPGMIGVCDPQSVGASLSNPRPVSTLTRIISTRAGLQTTHVPSLFDDNIIPYIISGDRFSEGSEFDTTDANGLFHPYIGSDGHTAFALKSTTSGPKRIMLLEYLPKGAFSAHEYCPLIYLDVNFTTPPVTPPETNTNTNAVTPPATNTNSVTPPGTTNTNPVTPASTSPKTANNFTTTKATGQIIKKVGDAATARLPATFSIEIGTINDKKPNEFEITPLFTEDSIKINGISNLPETKLAFEIQSDPILKVETTTDKQGAWSIDVPQKLSANLHTIYVTALSSEGQAIFEKTKLTEFNVVEKQGFVSSPNEQSSQKTFFAKYGGKIILGIGILSLLAAVIVIIRQILISRSDPKPY